MKSRATAGPLRLAVVDMSRSAPVGGAPSKGLALRACFAATPTKRHRPVFGDHAPSAPLRRCYYQALIALEQLDSRGLAALTWDASETYYRLVLSSPSPAAIDDREPANQLRTQLRLLEPEACEHLEMEAGTDVVDLTEILPAGRAKKAAPPVPAVGIVSSEDELVFEHADAVVLTHTAMVGCPSTLIHVRRVSVRLYSARLVC